MKFQVVVGAQFGSEAKGHVAASLIRREVREGNSVAVVRVAGPNAGHTVYDTEGNKFALRQIPVGAALEGNVAVAIAAGSEIQADVLFAEWDLLRSKGHRKALLVDPEATMLYPQNITDEAGMHEAIGSTGKGIGAARADRIMRRANRVCDDAEFMAACADRGIQVGPVVNALRSSFIDTCVIEGTQGYGLGLHAGFYPQCTSSDTRAIDFLAMVGISPWDPFVHAFEVWAVARVYPIRVAGNSGPLKDETTWEELGLPEERTTVTQKIRRVGGWDGELVRQAVQANGGAPVVRVALTMLDQKFPEVEGLTDFNYMPDIGVNAFIKMVEEDATAPVHLVTTSPTTAVWL